MAVACNGLVRLLVMLLVANVYSSIGECHGIHDVVIGCGDSSDGDRDVQNVNEDVKRLLRSRRAVRQVKVIEIPETQRTVITGLGSDYMERFTFKDPAPRHLNINPVMGAIHVRDGHKLDFETEPEVNFTVIVSAIGDGKRKLTIHCI
jgi:hypothetical protein